MQEYRVLYDTWIRGKPADAGKTMMLEPDRAKGYVKAGLIIDTATLAAAEAADAKNKAKAAKAEDAGK